MLCYEVNDDIASRDKTQVYAQLYWVYIQEHGRSLYSGLENGSLPVGSRGRDPLGLGTKHKSSKTPRKQMQATYTMSERGALDET